jgi:hypothetical protein
MRSSGIHLGSTTPVSRYLDLLYSWTNSWGANKASSVLILTMSGSESASCVLLATLEACQICGDSTCGGFYLRDHQVRWACFIS